MANTSSLHAWTPLMCTVSWKCRVAFFCWEQFSISLQTRDATVQEATHGGKLLVSQLRLFRTDTQFNWFYDQVVLLSSSLTDEPRLIHNSMLPRRFDQGERSFKYGCAKDKYHHAYFETLNLAVGTVETRFHQSDLHIIKDIESLLFNAANRKEM